MNYILHIATRMNELIYKKEIIQDFYGWHWNGTCRYIQSAKYMMLTIKPPRVNQAKNVIDFYMEITKVGLFIIKYPLCIIISWALWVCLVIFVFHNWYYEVSDMSAISGLALPLTGTPLICSNIESEKRMFPLTVVLTVHLIWSSAYALIVSLVN